MAGTAPDLSLPNSPFFHIHNDTPVATSSPVLPGGPCNFVDLTHGANGPKCGCRRFWSRGTLSARIDRGSLAGFPPGFSNGYSAVNSAGPADETAWCMCSHHACFHDDIRGSEAPAATSPVVNTMNNNGQENERPKMNRDPLTPVMPDLSFKMPPPPGQAVDFYTFNNPAAFSTHVAGEANMSQGEATVAAPEPSIPDTLSWTNLVHSEPEGAGLLPPIPSQCLMPSQPSSTTSSVRRGYLRPFAGKGLQTLSGVRSRTREPPAGQDNEVPPQEDAVESNLDHSVDDERTVTNTPRSCRHTDIVRVPSPSPTEADRDALHQISDTVQTHEQRLDRLENVSFSAVSHDGCDERHENADLRVTELESRVEEIEKVLNDDSSHVSGHRHSRRSGVHESTGSVVSVSTNGSEYMPSRTELYSQLNALKSQLSQLQGVSSFPSYTRPWEVEVIFLPFPLKSVWMETRDFASQRLSGGGSNLDVDQWTQLPNTFSNMDPQSPDFTDWAGPELESDWLLARACAPDRIVEQRLRSRGLVKNVTIRGPDARSVQQAMSDAFGTLFRTFSRMQANVHHGSTMHHRVAKFLGLESPWVPLRKIHKDSRLRFLSPPEMVTPVTWDVQFLRSSVVMKATGVQRLFITHPEAYLQDQDAYDNGWSWQRLRELSRVYADSQTSQEVPEADAKEDCWTWNNTIDEHPPSVNSSQSLSLRQAAQRNWRAISMSPSHGLLNQSRVMSPSLAPSRSGTRAKSPAILKERKASRPPHIRTTSMPPVLPPLATSAQSRRRVTPHIQPYERHSSPQAVRVVPSATHVAARVKRRSTRSPPGRRRITPRWSTASPSPIPEVLVARGTTPFYATPYSNGPFVDARPSISRGVVVFDENDLDERGSGTDPYDEGGDMDEDDDGADDRSEEEYNDSPMLDFAHPDSSSQEQESWQDGQQPVGGAPEDEPWPGIEDAENRDPDLAIDIHVDEDAMSDDEDDDDDDDEGAGASPGSRQSSVPSEYPSTQRAWTGGVGGEEAFLVYEDANNHAVSTDAPAGR
ncbi:hypothetical protein F5B20DRAFT_136675 [Whalleya microplaca]|nr:hypothetical protein F5B20DRAFT_136675 [Whalleya microplaca]